MHENKNHEKPDKLSKIRFIEKVILLVFLIMLMIDYVFRHLSWS